MGTQHGSLQLGFKRLMCKIANASPSAKACSCFSQRQAAVSCRLTWTDCVPTTNLQETNGGGANPGDWYYLQVG